MTDAHSNSADEASARVSAELKQAFDDLAHANIEPVDKARLQQRLLAITNAAKRDVSRADEQLVRYRDEWNVFRRGKEDAG